VTGHRQALDFTTSLLPLYGIPSLQAAHFSYALSSEPVSMARLQQRRLKVAAVAVLFTLVFTYISFKRDDPVTWHLPVESPKSSLISSTTSIHTPTQAQVKVLLTSSTVKAQQTFISELPAGIPIHVRPGDEGSRESESESESLSSPASPSATPKKECINYQQLQRLRQEPLSEGRRQFAYNRPSPECRTFNLPAMEKLIEKMKGVIKDPDLFRLFENSYPNTLDTMIKWRGYAKKLDPTSGNETTSDEELTYVITGDVWNSFSSPSKLVVS
jgi:hypothetical protein